ncbi:MAG: flavin reductase [Dehalococcoidia bacterium]|nr:flavin reductase [Dehalococcoidia bacterium]
MTTTLDKREFRNIMGTFATGVTLITAARDEVYTGITVNSFSSVSLDPVLVLVCIDLTAESHPFIAESRAFVINILARDQEDLSRQFATKDPDKDRAVRNIPHRIGEVGAPILEGTLAHLECTVVNEVHAGDHTVFVGEVVDAGYASDAGPPLVFYQGKYRDLAAPPEA